MAKLPGRGRERALQLHGEDAGVAELHGSRMDRETWRESRLRSFLTVTTFLVSTKAVDRVPETADDPALRGRLQMARVFHRPWPFDAIERPEKAEKQLVLCRWLHRCIFDSFSRSDRGRIGAAHGSKKSTRRHGLCFVVGCQAVQPKLAHRWLRAMERSGLELRPQLTRDGAAPN